MAAGTAPRWTSALDSVVVYAQGALCRRLARGTVPAGGRVRVAGLPRSLDPDSLRARVVGASGVRVTGARVEVEAESPGAEGHDEALREVERLRDACAAARGRRDRQRGLIEEVGALRPVPPARERDDPHRRTPVDAWLELSEFVDERLTGLHDRLRELEEELRRAEHGLTVAEDRLSRASADASPAPVAGSPCAVLTLDGAGEVEVEVEYGVPGAVWVPAYRLAHRQGDSDGSLVLRASVAQRTGEDWTGVPLALATADLRRRTELPRLRSIRIGRGQPAPAPSGWREHPAGLTDLFAGYDAAVPRPGTRSAAGAAPGPVPPPPPAPAGHGGPPGPVPKGALPQAFGGVTGPPRGRPGGGPRTAAGPAAPGAAPAPAAFGAAPPAPVASAAPAE
ncbi:DUF4140 domain-containing protein, partial [Streptomyces sp. NPDC126497]|uniref:DUF4140 domain-containing protein n=1 Tax=Streptomyces sp. NPDC126497 TaxID=3155313 RepID=UPI00332AAEFB